MNLSRRAIKVLSCGSLFKSVLILVPGLALLAGIGDAAQPSLSHSQLPVAFERIDSNSTFTAAGNNFRVTLRPQEILFSHNSDSIHVALPGSNPNARPSGVDPLPTTVFHYEGAQSHNTWRKDPNFAHVRYQEVYPGIDLVYYGNEGRLEYDFVLSPNADLRKIQMQITGVHTLRLDQNGNLLLGGKNTDLHFGKPLAYQSVGGVRRTIPSAFQLSGDKISFTLGDYDRSLPLIIDPTLNYSTSLGRSSQDKVNAIAVALDGSTYVAGTAPASSPSEQDEAFVAHISADGKTLLYMTYLGGGAATDARALSVSPAGTVFVTGETKAPDFPVLNPLQPSCTLNTSHVCAGDAYVAKLNPDGSLNFATYLGGSDEDAANAIALDSAGDIYIAGSTSSVDLPVVHGVQYTPGGHGDAFVAKLSSDGQHLLYATYLGGSGADQALGIAVDSNSNAYVTGQTQSIDFPMSQALQSQCRVSTSNQCQGSAFVTKLSSDGSQISFSTYLGGSGIDSANAIALDSAANIFIAGQTTSPDFPLLTPIQSHLTGKTAAFVAKLLPDGSALSYSTYLGGTSNDSANAIAIDSTGKAFISGQTDSPDFPTQAPVQSQCHKSATGACSTDAFLAVLNPKGTGLQFSTYLGGSGVDQGRGVAVDAKGSAYLGGATTTADFPLFEVAKMQSGVSATSAQPFGAAARVVTPPTADVTPGGIVSKISGIVPQVACAGTINWTGSAGDNQWTTATNWDTKTLPVSTDSVCIGTAFSAVTVTVNGISSAVNQTIASLVSNANISLLSGPLTVTGGATFANALSVTGGTLTLNGTNGSSVAKTMTLGNAILAGTDTLSITGLLTWNAGGEMCTMANCTAPTGAQGVTNANGGITGATTVYLYGRTLNNTASTTFSGSGYLYLAYGAIVNNSSTWNLTTDNGITYTTGSGTFNNTGTFEKTGGSATSLVDAPFTNTGSVIVNSATLNFESINSAFGGNWTVANGTTLDISALNSTIATLTGGTYSGSGLLQFGANENGIIDLAGAPSFTVAIGIPGATLDITSGTTVTFPSLTLGAGVLSGPGTVNVTGLLTWNSGGEMCTADNCTAPTGAQGITNANGGISAPAGTEYLYGRTLNNAATATFSGTNNLYLAYAAILNNLSTGTWNLTNDSYVNTSTGSGTFNNAGTFEKTGGSSSSIVYPLFVNTGKVLANSVTLDLVNVGTSGGGSWSAALNCVLDLSAANTSIITLTGGTYSGAGILNFGATNDGTIDLAGTPTFTIAVGIPGAILDITSGTTVTVPSLTLGSGILSGPGTMNVTGLLTWNSGGEMCTADNCTAPTGAQGVTNANGGISAPSGTEYLYGRTLNNAATATFAGTGNFYFAYAAIANNLSTGTWNLTNDSYVNSTTGGGTFNNAGIFEKTGGSTVSQVYPLFVNTGSVQANSNTINITNVGTSTGGNWSAIAGAVLDLSAAASSTATLTGGTYSGAGLVQFGASNTGIIDLAGAPTVSVPFGIAGAVLDITSGTTVTVPSLTLGNGVLSGPGTMTITGLLTWDSGGEMCTADNCTAPTGAQGVTNANGGISAPSGTEYLYGRTLNNAATATFGGTGNLYFAYAGILNNLSTGTWNLTNDSYLNTTTGSGTFNNAGTFEKTGGSTFSNVYPLFVNTGSVLANSVTLNLVNVGSSSGGSWSAAVSSVLDISAANTTTSTLTGGTYGGAGLVQFGATNVGTIDLAGAPKFTAAVGIPGGILDITLGTSVTVPSLTLGSGVLSGPGTMTISGLLTWNSGGEMCTADNCGAPTGAQGITNANGGIAGGTGNQFLYGRTLNNLGAATWNGTNNFYLAYAAIVNNLGGAVWNLTNDSYVNTSTGSGTFNNAGTFEKTGGSTYSIVYPVFVNTGSVQANAVTLNLTQVASSTAGSWSAAASSVLDISAANTATATLTSGTYSGAGLVQFGATNAGTIDLAGAPNFTVAVGIPGAILDITSGTSVTVPSLTLGSGVLSGPGTMTITGLLTWNASGEMCTADNCTAPTGAQGVTNANGGISAPSGTEYLYGRTLNNSATATFSGTGNFYLAYASLVNNLASGTWNLTNDSFLNTTTGGGTFNNSGAFEKTGGTTYSYVYPIFNNSGTVSANLALLAFQGSYTQTAGTTILGGGSLGFSSTPAIEAGSLTGSGTISGNYTGSISTNPAGVIAPGTSNTNGTIALTGSGSGLYSEGTGAFTVKIGGTGPGQFDTLTATGTATLGGTLNVNLINGYTGKAGDTFTILTAGSVSGKFSSLAIPAGWTVTYNPASVVLNAVAGAGPVASLGSPGIAFPNTLVTKSSSVMTVTLQNTGTAALTIASIVSGDPAEYVYSADPSKPCPISPATLAAGASCIIDVTFTPASAGLHTSQITVTDNSGNIVGSTQTISLTGTGIVLSSIAVTPAAASINAAATQQFTAIGTYSDGTTANITTTVNWLSSNTSVATIAATGLATGASAGSSNITASLSGITSNTAVLTVTKTLQSIAVTPTTASVAVGATQQFTAIGTYSDGTTANITTTVNWLSSNTSVATIAATGLATGGSAGSSNISASLSGITSNTAVLTVTKTLQSIAVTPTTASVAVGATQQFTAIGTYSDGTTANITTTVNWLSSNTSVATIAATGLAAGGSAGSSNITASLSGITSNTAVLTVTKTLQSIAVTPTTASVAVGATQQFTAIGTYSDGTTANITTTVNWLSSNTSVATIAATGLATGASAGSSNITASLSGITSNTAVLTVTKTLQSIAVTPTTASVAVGATQQFTAIGTYSDGTTANITTTVNWLSSNTSVATIAATGLATGGSAGSSNISASLSGITSNTAVLTVTKTLQSIAVTPTTASVAVGATQQFTAIGTYSDGTTANITTTVSWLSSNTSVATIAATGLATGASAGSSNISASLSGITSNTAVLTVTKTLQSIAVTPTTASVAVGATQQFTAIGTYSDGTTANITTTVSWLSSNTSVATIAATGLATGASAGSSNITASLSGITSNTAVLTVTKTLQSIAVTPTTASVAVGATQQFTAIGTYSDGTTANITTTVNWLSSNTSVATIAATGLATGGSAGSSNISASLSGITSNTAVLTVTKTLQSIAVTPTTASVAVGATQQFTAIGTYSDGTTANITTTVNWLSSNTSVATIAATGLAAGGSAGSSNITASLSGITSNTAVLTVTKTLQSIAVTPTTASVAVGATQQFTAIGTYSDGTTANITTTVNWLSSNTSVATIAATGLATGASAGSSNITASLSGITSNTAVLTVTKTLQSIAVTPTTASVAVGATQQFTAIGTYSDGTTANITTTVNWLSSNTSVATIAATGLATGGSAGSSNISASLSGITSNTAVLTVTKTLQSIAVTPTTASVAVGATQQFTAIGTYSDGTTANITTTVSWLSSNTSVATIAATGLATGASAGSSNISASLSGITSNTAVLTVTKTLQSIAVTPTTASVAVGATQQFTAIGTYSDGTTANITTTVSWLSSNTSVATIAATGLATGASAGSSNITASLSGITSNTAVLTVTKTLQSIAVTPTTASVAVGATQQFTAIGTYSDGTTANITTTVNWLSSNTSVATIAATGLATGASAGSSNITASLSGITSNTAVLTVTKTLQSIAVTPTTASVAVGATQQFTAIGTYSDGTTANITTTVNWLSSNTPVATIAATGLATGASAGSSNITASLSGITSNTAVLTVTAPSGEPAVTITLLDQSAPGPAFYVDLQITNTGVGPASSLSINQVTFRTLGGTGAVTQVSPALPIAVGSLAPSASTTVRIFLNVPSTVTRFSMGEAGTVQDSNATTFNYASSQLIAY